MKTNIIFLLILLTCEYYYTAGVGAVSVTNDLSLTNSQKTAMDKFKKVIIPKLPHKYMHEEIYLVRWLRARNFDVRKAEDFLLQNLKWRKENKLDAIHLEDWSDIHHDFPYYIDGYDKTGRPIITAISREWDIRSAIVTGRIGKVLRYLDKAMDEATGIVRDLQISGKNVTQFIFIVHLGNFNLYQHGCPRCVTRILEFLDSYENHFPGMADKIIFIQTPPAFDALARILRETMTPLTREAMKIYSTNPKEWKEALLKFISEDQLTVEFGGTKPEPSHKRSYY